MNARQLHKLLALVITAPLLFVFIAPVQAAAPAALPTFEKFAKTVANGKPGEVRGVYVPDVLALRVAQQPADKPAYVSSAAGVATQFQMAARQGVTGLLGHNYAAGAQFVNLAVGQEVRVVYGDGTVKRYTVSAIYEYQALDPNNPRGDLVDLSTGDRVTAVDVFTAMYTGGDHVTFQTCVAKDGNLSWGRLFVVATPVQ
jgi:hypothetical protein